MNQTSCYNTTPELWESFARSQPMAILKVVDGHVFCGHDCLARFENNNHAEKVLSKKWIKASTDGLTFVVKD